MSSLIGYDPLPLILLGPILRRAEEKQVCIWLACSKPVTIKADIYKFDDRMRNTQGPSQSNAIGSGIAKSLQLGEHLHVALVIVNPIDPTGLDEVSFPTDDLLAYDIELIDNESGTSTNLKELGLLNGENSIVYSNEYNTISSLPTFYLPGKDTPLNLLHGSCRKLHGKGEDCLAASDEIIRSSFNDLKRRPSILFLTGDQIYADDVAGALSHYLTQLGVSILGREEKINDIEKNLSEIPIGDRQILVKKHAGFTSGNADNHLLSFGEFAAMYLLAWNVENWPANLPDVTMVPKKHRRKYDDQIKQLEITRNELPAVRRILANIPTYMIFDDHDITDDWNITKEWYENVKASNCGRQVIANGLAAYWAFQGWGNDPSLFSRHFINSIVEFLSKDGNVNEAEQLEFENLLWNFNNWSYRVPISPLTIVTDCRTQRQYDSYNGPPQLLSSTGFDSILQAASEANYQKGGQVIIISPTPVFGFLLLEELQKAAANLASVYKLDLETWFANERGLVNFLGFLMEKLEPKQCIFLSGDVHYGFTISASFALLLKKDCDEYLHMSIVQLTSSALKTTSLVKVAFISDIMGRIRQLFPWKQVVRIGWLSNGGGDSDDVVTNYSNRLSSKSLRIREKPAPHLEVMPKKAVKKLSALRPPDWIEARYIVKPAGSIFSPLLISDNNIGLVTIDANRIIHNFVTRKEMTRPTRFHRTIVEMKGGRNELDRLMILKMHKFVHG